MVDEEGTIYVPAALWPSGELRGFLAAPRMT